MKEISLHLLATISFLQIKEDRQYIDLYLVYMFATIRAGSLSFPLSLF